MREIGRKIMKDLGIVLQLSRSERLATARSYETVAKVAIVANSFTKRHFKPILQVIILASPMLVSVLHSPVIEFFKK